MSKLSHATPLLSSTSPNCMNKDHNLRVIIRPFLLLPLTSWHHQIPLILPPTYFWNYSLLSTPLLTTWSEWPSSLAWTNTSPSYLPASTPVLLKSIFHPEWACCHIYLIIALSALNLPKDSSILRIKSQTPCYNLWYKALVVCPVPTTPASHPFLSCLYSSHQNPAWIPAKLLHCLSSLPLRLCRPDSSMSSGSQIRCSSPLRETRSKITFPHM